jgi:integrase
MNAEELAVSQEDGWRKVVKMVVGSAIGDDGEEVYPRKWNHEFIDLPEVERQRTPTFTPEEVQQIISNAEGQFAVLYALLAASGIRIGEALALEVNHFLGRTLSIRQSIWNGLLQSPKTRAGVREVDLAPTIARMLGDLIGERTTGFLFPRGEEERTGAVERAPAQPTPDPGRDEAREMRLSLVPQIPRHASAKAGNT